jgi:hypothetical protein
VALHCATFPHKTTWVYTVWVYILYYIALGSLLNYDYAATRQSISIVLTHTVKDIVLISSNAKVGTCSWRSGVEGYGCGLLVHLFHYQCPPCIKRRISALLLATLIAAADDIERIVLVSVWSLLTDRPEIMRIAYTCLFRTCMCSYRIPTSKLLKLEIVMG